MNIVFYEEFTWQFRNKENKEDKENKENKDNSRLSDNINQILWNDGLIACLLKKINQNSFFLKYFESRIYSSTWKKIILNLKIFIIW
jgi:hypothetical protein